MKNLTRLVLTFILVFLLSCNNKQSTDPPKTSSVDTDLPQIKQRGKLIALTGYNAYSYFIYKGQPMGFEYDLVNQLADHLGLELDIVVVKEIDKMFEMLNDGEGDLIAFNLTVTKKRADKVAFTLHHHTTRQVLVQRRPDNWRSMRVHVIENQLLRNPIDLAGKTVYVRKGSAYFSRLKNLSDEIGGGIHIVEADSELTTEDLIEMVAEGKIDYTVSDENIAQLNQAYYSNLDIATAISLPQKIAWAVRKNCPKLLKEVNSWLKEVKKTPAYYVTYNKYYKNRNDFKNRIESKYFTNRSGKLSKYDELLKEYAKHLNWDWRIIASQIYQESQFDPSARSWAGAVGLMQLLPATAKKYGADDPYDPLQSLKAGISYLEWLDKYFMPLIANQNERIKFVLASYNIGFGHVEDAMRLADKYGANPKVWDGNVAVYLLKKSQKKYYNDPVVKNGYCRGRETVKYVEEIFNRYKQYTHFIS